MAASQLMTLALLLGVDLVIQTTISQVLNTYVGGGREYLPVSFSVSVPPLANTHSNLNEIKFKLEVENGFNH